MPELTELTDEELVMVAGGVSLIGGASTAFSGGIGTSTTSSATTITSTTTAIGGGTIAADGDLFNFHLTLRIVGRP